MQSITTFLMFQGQAKEAIQHYISIFKDGHILSLSSYGEGEEGPEGGVRHAIFSLKGQEFMAIDSSIEHGFTFTPSMSLYITCESEAEIDALFERLSEGGQVMMPLEAYPFAAKFAWVADRFGVSWQLSLPA